jgi:hypothetical protein
MALAANRLRYRINRVRHHHWKAGCYTSTEPDQQDEEAAISILIKQLYLEWRLARCGALQQRPVIEPTAGAQPRFVHIVIIRLSRRPGREGSSSRMRPSVAQPLGPHAFQTHCLGRLHSRVFPRPRVIAADQRWRLSAELGRPWPRVAVEPILHPILCGLIAYAAGFEYLFLRLRDGIPEVFGTGVCFRTKAPILTPWPRLSLIGQGFLAP